MSKAASLIAPLPLLQHRTRGGAAPILLLLETGDNSRRDRTGKATICLWHAGNARNQRIASSDSGPASKMQTAHGIAADGPVQQAATAHRWRAAKPCYGTHDAALVSGLVSPGTAIARLTRAASDRAPGVTLP